MAMVLDCTIRDGGHLNGWNFTDECVRDTFEAAKKSGVEYFEIGYRNHEVGKFAQCRDEDLRSIIKDKGNVKLVVMVNVREFDSKFFHENDFVDVVRIACHPHEVYQGVEICKYLRAKGYETILHLMDVAHISKEQYSDLKNYDKKSILYFADSYGALIPQDISKCFDIFRKQGFKKIGFHAHNNKQLALINTLTAVFCGAYSVDVTAYGMGRAAGNTPAELLLSETKQDPKPYIELIEKYYLDFYKQTPWGYSLENLKSGIQNAKLS